MNRYTSINLVQMINSKFGLAFIFILISFCSCDEREELIDLKQEPIECNSAALFSREDVSGIMVYLPCYDSWAIKLNETNEDDSHLIAASKDVPESYQMDSLAVRLSACFYEFDLELLFPDPAPWGEMYVIKDFQLVAE